MFISKIWSTMKEQPIGSNSSVKVCKLVMLVILLFYSCNQDYSNETHVVLPDKRLLFIIDQYVKMDTAFTDTRLITLTQLNVEVVKLITIFHRWAFC